MLTETAAVSVVNARCETLRANKLAWKTDQDGLGRETTKSQRPPQGQLVGLA